MPFYNTVLFDADNTLFDFCVAERAALTSTLLLCGIAPTEERVAVYSRINDDMWKRLERGEITKEVLRELRFREFCRAIGACADTKKMAELYVEQLSGRHDLIPGAVRVARELSEHFSLYIVTNGIKTVQKRRFAASALQPFFKDVFISEELGFEKPHRGYFAEVARRIKGFSAEKTLIVGDSLSSDIKGGIDAGIDTCWFDPKGSPCPNELKPTYRVEALEDLVPLLLP